jgi:single-strand DNA-binding protein
MITVTITGNLADDPHSFRTSDGRAGCDLRIAVDLPPRGATGDSQVRYVKAVAFGVLASHAAESVRKGDRVTIQGHDLTAEAWVTPDGEPRGKVRIAVTEIAASLRFDTVTTGRSVRGAQRDAGRPANAAVQAERAVLAGVTR